MKKQEAEDSQVRKETNVYLQNVANAKGCVRVLCFVCACVCARARISSFLWKGSGMLRRTCLYLCQFVLRVYIALIRACVCVCVYMYVCVCVFVREREREEREREIKRTHLLSLSLSLSRLYFPPFTYDPLPSPLAPRPRPPSLSLASELSLSLRLSNPIYASLLAIKPCGIGVLPKIFLSTRRRILRGL